jgi:hypothetical protein
VGTFTFGARPSGSESPATLVAMPAQPNLCDLPKKKEKLQQGLKKKLYFCSHKQFIFQGIWILTNIL